jgi:hypothetical protein
MRKNRFKPFVFAASFLALAMAAGHAYAQTVTLSCRYTENGGGAFTYRVDYATGRLEELGPSGTAYSNRIVTATISPNAIVWSIDQPSSYMTGDNVTHKSSEHWEGRIDRLATTGWVQSYDYGLYHYPGVSVTCSKGEAKF